MAEYNLYRIATDPHDPYKSVAVGIVLQPALARDELGRDVWSRQVDTLNQFPINDVRSVLATLEGLRVESGENVSPFMIETAILYSTHPDLKESTTRAFPPAPLR
jgi:hypothetical protein